MFSLSEGQYQSAHLLLLTRNVSALLFCTGAHLHGRWTFTELNPAGGPSRVREPKSRKKGTSSLAAGSQSYTNPTKRSLQPGSNQGHAPGMEPAEGESSLSPSQTWPGQGRPRKSNKPSQVERATEIAGRERWIRKPARTS